MQTNICTRHKNSDRHIVTTVKTKIWLLKYYKKNHSMFFFLNFRAIISTFDSANTEITQF